MEVGGCLLRVGGLPGDRKRVPEINAYSPTGQGCKGSYVPINPCGRFVRSFCPIFRLGRHDESGFSKCLLSITSTLFGLLLAKLPATRNYKSNSKFFILGNFAVYSTLFYIFVTFICRATLGMKSLQCQLVSNVSNGVNT